MDTPLLSQAKGSRAPLVTAALVHPGFAHVPDASLRASVFAYLRRCEGEDEFHIDWNDRTMRAFAMSHTAERFGVTCALCGRVRRKPGRRTDPRFLRWLVGPYEDACLPAYRTDPVCCACSPGAMLQPWRKGQPIEEVFDWYMCWLFANWFFRDRIAKHAEDFRGLRFDPRRRRPAPAEPATGVTPLAEATEIDGSDPQNPDPK